MTPDQWLDALGASLMCGLLVGGLLSFFNSWRSS